jgi:hypothetical protein
MRRSEAGLPVERRDYHGGFDRPLVQDSAGRFFLPDSHGVHVRHKQRWTYQPLFQRNFKENRWFGDRGGIAGVVMKVGFGPRVYAWARWGPGGMTGTIGYWVCDEGQWTNVDDVERVAAILPRADGSVWLVLSPQDDMSEAEFVILENGRAIRGAAAQERLCPGVTFTDIYVMTAKPDGPAYVLLYGALRQGVVGPLESLAAVLPPAGPARLLGPKADRFFRERARSFTGGFRRDLGVLVVGPKGWLWTGGDVVSGMSPDGSQFRTLWHARHLSDPWAKTIDPQGNLYVESDRRMWRVDTTAMPDDPSGDPLLPEMRVADVSLVSQDSLGRIWCTWENHKRRVGFFDGRRWTCFADRDLAPTPGAVRPLLDAIPGAAGSMIFTNAEGAVFLHDTQGWVHAHSVPALARRHAARLHKALADAPRTGRRSPSIFFGGKSHLWWSHGGLNWGALGMDGHTAGFPCPRVLVDRLGIRGLLAPVGDGSRVFLANADGPRGLLAIDDGRIVLTAPSPLPPNPARDDGSTPFTILDSRGCLWFCDRNRTHAITPQGEYALSVEGTILLADRAGGHWFTDQRSSDAWLVRRAPDERLATSDVLERHFTLESLAEAPDGTVWTLTATELLRLRAGTTTIAIVERYPMCGGGTLWCDTAGRVWRKHGSRLVRYATTTK